MPGLGLWSFGGTSVCSMVFFLLEFFPFFFCQWGHANLYIRKCRAVEITGFYNTRSGFSNKFRCSHDVGRSSRVIFYDLSVLFRYVALVPATFPGYLVCDNRHSPASSRRFPLPGSMVHGGGGGLEGHSIEITARYQTTQTSS